MIKQEKYPTDEFRREAVRLLESSGKSVPELARELGSVPNRCIVGASNTAQPRQYPQHKQAQKLLHWKPN